ncbi:MAG: DNA polymerase III subunit delta [Pseudomonadota bacterium]
MVAIKAQDRQKFLKSLPGPACVVLVYGTDAGLITETARDATERLANAEDPPGETIRIEDVDLDSDPDRLIVELQTIPMFGGTKVVRTTVGRKINANMLKSVFETGPPAAVLVIEAGNLKPSDTLRKIAEKTKWAAAVPCYADSAQDLSRMVAEMISASGKHIGDDAMQLLVSRLGADRALSRSEVEKLILSVGNDADITEAAILDTVGDVSELTVDRVVLAVADGQPTHAIEALERAVAAGQPHQTLLLALQRHMLLLHRIRARADDGARLDEVFRGLRPPVHFKLRDALTRQTRKWSRTALSAALARVQAVIRQTRGGRAAIEGAMTERLIIDLAKFAQRQ